MTVLVLASELDRTADGVVSGLVELGVPVMRLDLSWFPQRLTLDAEFGEGSWHGSLRTEHHEVDLATVRSVWVRTPSSFQMPEGMSAVEREFARREAKLGVGGVLLALPGVLWVNRPDLAVDGSLPAGAVGNGGTVRTDGAPNAGQQRSGGGVALCAGVGGGNCAQAVEHEPYL
ncbi:MAG: MvdC/MvdD family ATP grasp protein [Pseudonocardiaceae bacterium]